MSPPYTAVRTPHLVSIDDTITLPEEIHLFANGAATAIYETDVDVEYPSLDALAQAHMLTDEGLDEAIAVAARFSAEEEERPYLALGFGSAGPWMGHAAHVLAEQKSLRQHARDHGLFDRGAVDGLCSLSGILREGAWLVLVTTKASQLNRDP